MGSLGTFAPLSPLQNKQQCGKNFFPAVIVLLHVDSYLNCNFSCFLGVEVKCVCCFFTSDQTWQNLIPCLNYCTVLNIINTAGWVPQGVLASDGLNEICLFSTTTTRLVCADATKAKIPSTWDAWLQYSDYDMPVNEQSDNKKLLENGSLDYFFF